jgi:hypothetical protein
MTQSFQSVGLGLATAIGTGLSRPDRLTVLGTGDGSMCHCPPCHPPAANGVMRKARELRAFARIADSAGSWRDLPKCPLGRQLLVRWHCLELLLAGEIFHVVQGLQGNDPAIFLIEL